MKINYNNSGHMTKIAAMPIYGINHFKIYIPGTSWPILTKRGMKHRGLKLIIICSNDNPGLTLALFTAWSNFATKVFIWENVTMMDSLKMFASCELEFGLYNKLNY